MFLIVLETRKMIPFVRLLIFVCAYQWCILAAENNTTPATEAAEARILPFPLPFPLPTLPPFHYCPNNQVWNQCGSQCEQKCGQGPMICTLNCPSYSGACVCASGYCRNSYGQCVTYTPPCPSPPPYYTTTPRPPVCNLYCRYGYICRLIYPPCAYGSYCPPYPQCVPGYNK